MNDVDAVRAYYDASLPYYDAMLADRGDLPFWESMATRWNSKRILELGCGTGRVTTVLSRHGHVTAVDLLVEMLQGAAKNAPDARLAVADLRCFAFATAFDLIVLADDPMSHLTSPIDRNRVMRNIADHLAPDGRVVIEGLYRRGRERVVVPRREIHDGGHSFTVEEVWEPAEGDTWKATYRYQHGHSAVNVSGTLRSWTQHEVGSLRDCGLDVESAWGDFDEGPLEEGSPRVVIVARTRT